METTTSTTLPDLQQQRDYVAAIAGSGFNFSLTVGDAFVRGIRDLGYKSTATALDEDIDNSDQAGASQVHVAFGFGASTAKPDRLAIIDDGHGMDPDMIRLAALWGGTHRENDRAGFGRYGYGLPSSSVSQGRRFTILSRTSDGDWHSVTLDLDDISDGKLTNESGQIVVPPAVPARIPSWVEDYITEHFGEPLEHGTIVLLEKLDRLSWKSATTLKEKLLEHFGVTYRNFLRSMELYVDGTPVLATDPLFLTPGMRFYDLDEDRAEALPELRVTVKSEDGVKHPIVVRYAYFPPTFARVDKLAARSANNKRFAVMKDHIGVIVLRNGRQIDVVTTGCPWTKFQNNDAYWGVEVDFPASLDEEFSITTSKQRVILSERIWEILRENGVHEAIKDLRKRYTQDTAKLKAAIEEEEERKRASEQAMEEASQYKTTKPDGDPAARQEENEDAFQREVNRRAKSQNRKREDVERELRTEIEGQPYRVVQETLPGAPFYRVEQLGGQKVLYLNTAHRFYTDVYSPPESTPTSRAALEVLLFVMGECELDSSDQRRLFYQSERAEWSNRLTVALDRLSDLDPVSPQPPEFETDEAEGSAEAPAA